MKTRHSLWLLWLLAGPLLATEPLSLNEARRLAENHVPQLEASRAQETAAREMAVAAGQLPDPVLKLGVNNVPVAGEMAWSLTQEGMTMRQVGLMQEFTHGDKRQARADKALREADLARSNQRQILADTRRETTLAWLDVAYQESMRSLLEQQISELKLQKQVAESAFRAARGEQADVFANRLAIERTQDQLAQMQRDIAMARARLARWVGDAAERPVDAPPPLASLDWQPEDLREASASHPTLAAQQGMVAVAEADARVARENRKPDVAVELMYGFRGPSYANMVSLNVSMPLPWDRASRQDRELGAKLAQLDEARARQEDMRRAYLSELRGNLAVLKNSRERLQRYDEVLIPLSNQQIDAALAAYRAGSGSLPRVLEARRMTVDTRMERQRVALEAARAWAQLNFLNPQEDQSSPAQGAQQ
ncbi:TolC family protein [Uliginosibacterium sp. 31-16]|uniref:TolC family protein n=1 Tax=Uliginosibacterium sp. 31-16 TaxID=3068315 RepID=UPI00273DDDA6|nr:TolC family protein [Uliginosibacterium sp. 31-16]MDP5238753.1 TolC family protein [Uliginosibacterium sp. 31-16]